MVPMSDGQSSYMLLISQVNEQSMVEGLPITTTITATMPATIGSSESESCRETAL